MNKKFTAIVFAAVLASPLTMASISRADGGGLEFEKNFCLPATGTTPVVGTCIAPNIKGEAEVEYSRRLNTTTGFVKSRLSGEVELRIPAVGGVAGALPTGDVDITIEPLVPPMTLGSLSTFGAPILCTFVNMPSIRNIFNTAVPPVLVATKVGYQGSLSQSTDPGFVPPTPTLNCGTTALPTLLKGSKVTVGVGAFEVKGTLRLDD